MLLESVCMLPAKAKHAVASIDEVSYSPPTCKLTLLPDRKTTVKPLKPCLHLHSNWQPSAYVCRRRLSEQYNLHAQLYCHQEALLPGQTVPLLLQLALQLHGSAAPLQLLQEVTVRITAATHEGGEVTQVRGICFIKWFLLTSCIGTAHLIDYIITLLDWLQYHRTQGVLPLVLLLYYTAGVQGASS